METTELTDHSFSLCQKLLRMDTTNPPGNERIAADLVATELRAAGLEPQILESEPKRANVVARLKGTGERPPLLLTAHLDVVEADASRWEHPPFCGEVHNGFLWGRGAIDMKNMAAMSVAILCKLAREKAPLNRDIIFAAVADEEAGCRKGSLWLCEHHPDLVRAEYAIGEGGGFNLQIAGKTYFTVQIAEKGVMWLKARVQGEPGHGSMPRRDSAVVRLGEKIARLGKTYFPFHRSAPMTEFAYRMAQTQPAWMRPLLRLVLLSRFSRPLLLRLLGENESRGLLALLSNTASPTVVRAGNKTNVIPGSAEVEIDGRFLPGQTQAEFLRELRAILGDDVDLQTMHTLPAVHTDPYESPLYSAISQSLLAHAPGCYVIPYMLPGFTDAKAFTQLGAKWYGFAPVRLPADLRFADLFHGHNERIPVDGLAWGTQVLYDTVSRFCS